MKKLNVKLENCFGIGKLDFEFDFSQTNTILVYAPNGTMKTSFSKTFDIISKSDKKTIIKDKIFPERKVKHELLFDSKAIKSDEILVINGEDKAFDASNKISSFIASKELKNKYDQIYFELEEGKNSFIKKLKSTSSSTDCETEFLEVFNNHEKFSFFNSLVSLEKDLKTESVKYTFKYNDVFDKKGNVLKFLEKHTLLLKQYFENYESLIKSSSFFQKSSNSFGTTQVNEIIKAIEDNSFFDAGHIFRLKDGKEIKSKDDIKQVVETEISKIINDDKLKESFDKIDKAIGGNAELRTFKNVIEENNLLLLDLVDYENFKRKVWIGYLYELKMDVIELIKIFNSKKKELDKILDDASKEVSKWKEIISIFNSRFYVPFIVKIKNQEDLILKKESANLEFEYLDSENENPSIQNKDILLDVLSKGELRAYFILQMIFEIESRKSESKESVLIFDDIADSFDYKNKYAIIEYINDFQNTNIFKSIILTHNFDFYRTISSRLGLKESVFMVTKNKKREITFNKGQYRNDVFNYFIKKTDNTKIFISLIPFIRNLIEYTEGDKSDGYLFLTNCLHIKKDSYEILTKDVFEIFKDKIGLLKLKTISFENDKIIDLIYETARLIINDKNLNEISLENKIVLSIAIRLKAEEFMIKNLSNIDFTKIESNQTRALFVLFKEVNNNTDTLKILDKVNLMTPENIHINAFMYEPLIDMSVKHLTELYNQINSLL